jgi:glycosyltransferase involved in cell wall biosynthesis
MLSFYLFFGILYALLLLAFGKIWRASQVPCDAEAGFQDVSIVVAYRNEITNLPILLDSILELASRPLELILVNDHSEDGGERLADTYRDRFLENDVNLVLVESKGIGKKAAIATGVALASAEVILTTDADCALPVAWVQGMFAPFKDAEVRLVAGPVMSSGHSGFSEVFQQIEWASILLVTQAGFSFGKPIMCSAANLAFRKSSFFQVNGFDGNDHIPTGDDEFLLKKFVSKFGPVSARYLTGGHVLVKTRPHARWSALFSQRIRWASKWRMHRSASHLIAAVFPVLVQLVWLGSFTLLFKGLMAILVFFFIWILKISYEKMVLGKVLKGFSVLVPRAYYWITSLVHPWYVLGTAVGTLFLNYTWKGRKYGGKQ